MTFWQLAYNQNWISPSKEIAAIKLRLVVFTESNPHGEITIEEYKAITGLDF